MTVFGSYSSYYNLFYKGKDYVSEAEYVISHIRRHSPHADSLLELGCGTGKHAEHLVKLGYTVQGVDFSDNMLKEAELIKMALPRELGARLNFTHGDARALRLDKQFDVVLSLFHVFSYQTANADLSAIIGTAATHLAAGGILLFDFWYGPAVLRQLPETRVLRLEDEQIHVTRIAEPVVHVNKNIVDVNYEILVEHKQSRQLEKIRETHSMRYLFMPELELLLAQHGLEIIGSYAWMKAVEPDLDSWNACVVARRL